MDEFLEKHNLPILNEEEAEILNRPITPNEIETVIKTLPTHKSSGPDGFTRKFYKAFKEELTAILHRLLENIQTDGRLPNSFFFFIVIQLQLYAFSPHPSTTPQLNPPPSPPPPSPLVLSMCPL